MAIAGGGNDNGRLDNPPGVVDAYTEANALWEQLSKAGFINGSYVGPGNQEPNTTNGAGPFNPFNSAGSSGNPSAVKIFRTSMLRPSGRAARTT